MKLFLIHKFLFILCLFGVFFVDVYFTVWRDYAMAHCKLYATTSYYNLQLEPRV